MEGCRAEYASLCLVVQRREESFEFTVFDGNTIVWRANATNREAAKDGAVFEALEWLGHPSVPSPAWEPFTEEIRPAQESPARRSDPGESL